LFIRLLFEAEVFTQTLWCAGQKPSDVGSVPVGEKHLVVGACGQLTAEEAGRALDGRLNISHTFAGKKQIRSSNDAADP
jgi:hypothetical protein